MPLSCLPPVSATPSFQVVPGCIESQPQISTGLLASSILPLPLVSNLGYSYAQLLPSSSDSHLPCGTLLYTWLQHALLRTSLAIHRAACHFHTTLLTLSALCRSLLLQTIFHLLLQVCMRRSSPSSLSSLWNLPFPLPPDSRPLFPEPPQLRLWSCSGTQ